MQDTSQHVLDLSRPEEIAYWSRLLSVAPMHLLSAAKATGSNLINRMIYYLKAEGILPFYFDLRKIASANP